MVVKTARRSTGKEAVPPVDRSPGLIYEPKTPLGRTLWEIRKRIVASGEPLLSWEEIEREVAERRGEADEER